MKCVFFTSLSARSAEKNFDFALAKTKMLQRQSQLEKKKDLSPKVSCQSYAEKNKICACGVNSQKINSKKNRQKKLIVLVVPEQYPRDFRPFEDFYWSAQPIFFGAYISDPALTLSFDRSDWCGRFDLPHLAFPINDNDSEND